ncbi:diacylglycerol/lipid kinase family protein [Runella sp.]|uniref:diacylglycerol/lipid kinase family protein n=1 Tax=Runella sp. TaxID=1960881 RepID=UPI003D1482BF
MMFAKKALFIINPKSGTRSDQQRKRIQFLIEEHASRFFKVETVFTSHPHHATQEAHRAIRQGFDYVVAAGGDGTVNEIAKTLINSPVTLGILPLGSGNGLARHLGISMAIEKALRQLCAQKTMEIDACFLNQMPFFCTAGVGFDAYVAAQFATYSSRGLQRYAQVSFQSFFRYKAKDYLLELDGQEIQLPAFAVTFANASQYGNNAYVAPQAKIDDGLIDVCLLSPFPKPLAPIIAARLFQGTLPQSSYVHTYKVRKAKISASEKLLIHFDGEPLQLETNELTITIQPKCLKVLV